VPIGNTDRQWGVLIVVQEYGSLFPADDLEFIQVLCRQATLTLDHARLIEAERAMQQRSAALRLRDSEVRFARILESIRDYAVLLVNDAGAILAWKAGADVVFGATAELMIGASAAPLYRRSDAEFRALLAEARQSGYLDDENPCQRHDGAVFFASTTIRPIHEQSVGLSGFVVVTRDETERRALAERCNRRRRWRPWASWPAASPTTSTTCSPPCSATRDHRVASGLRPRARRTSDRNSPHRRACDGADPPPARVQPAAGRAAAARQPRRHRARPRSPMLDRVLEDRVQVEFRAEAEGWILADPVQIEQVVLNLAVNARDAMPSGGTIEIRTTTVALDQPTRMGDSMLAAGFYSSLTVADRGAGMDAATMARIFRAVFHDQRVGRGTGLGLSTVYGIVKQMGGGIHVTSAPGKGTTFMVLLPSRRAEAPAVDLPDTAEERLDGHETILVAEDDDAIRGLLESWLHKTRLSRDRREQSGAGARPRWLTRPSVDLVVSDVIMPGGSGPALVRELQQQRRRCRRFTSPATRTRR
jgi:PAS domain S-box-containing protein